MQKLISIITMCFLLSTIGFSQENKVSDIVTAMQKGSAQQLSAKFNNSVELIVLGPGKIYNKSQAMMVMKDFFKKHPVNSFEPIHEIDKKTSFLLLGKMVSGKDAYRIQFLLKGKDSKLFIHQIRIQNAN